MVFPVIFFISFLCILLELFLTRILNFKTWNHIVYIIIPFAILGYGIGANLFLILEKKFLQYKQTAILAACLILIGGLTLLCPLWIAFLPIQVQDITHYLTQYSSWQTVVGAYTLTMLPFTVIGFLVVYLFSTHPKISPKLYFFDLLGAGLGAYVFFPLINTLAVFHALTALSLAALTMAVCILFPRRRILVTAAGLLLFCLSLLSPEFDRYTIDSKKGWEWIPGTYAQDTYQEKVSRWHPLGRTNIYRITDEKTRREIMDNAQVTFEINVEPPPEFSYVATNFLAGTPIYNLSPAGFAAHQSRIHPFSTRIEFPYTILRNPDVFVIGAGGGRDIFIAKTHGARKIVGAEINPAIYEAMMPGGAMYDYSGRIYTSPDTKIFNLDGRHLVKRQPDKSFDLIILNGVDTFSGLSSGAYAYAESYLYTKEAVADYLRVLRDDGVINFNRWLFWPFPRESLRLEAIALEALRESGASHPQDHIIIGGTGWSFILVKKTPFTPQERATITQYFNDHSIALFYPELDKKAWDQTFIFFKLYAEDFQHGREKSFARAYPYDISVVTDDSPFFYKYYKFRALNAVNVVTEHHTGTIIFMTQMIILGQSLFFILLFILVPLAVFRRRDLFQQPLKKTLAFIIYFSCLGLGYMLIEIALMQKLTLILGSPIYSISITLAVLLCATGLGSLLLPSLQKRMPDKAVITTAAFALGGLLALLIFGEHTLTALLLARSLPERFLGCAGLLFPLGLCLGVFFPAGLQSISRHHASGMAWAWGINCGCSVLGGILAIICAQITGFNAILALSIIIYLMALFAYLRMTADIPLTATA